MSSNRAREAFREAGIPDPTNQGNDAVAPTEDAIALAFAEQNAGRRVYDHTQECWFVWNAQRWILDQRKSTFHAARDFTARCATARRRSTKPLARIVFAAAVKRAARADPRLAVSHEVWDTDRWRLGTPNGVVDLHTGELLPPSPDLYISRHTSVTPAPPGTPAPIWQAFLDSATKHDKDLQAFLRRLCGYFLTGDVSEEIMAFLYGPGGCGKGTLLTGLTGILGEYAVAVPIEVFTAGSFINLEYYRAQMAGARLITASETEAQQVWAEQLIKDITGNDTKLSARHPYGKPFNYWSQAKILIIGNHAPKLKGRSSAMERRLRIVPFTFAPPKPDKDLKEFLERAV